MELGHSKADAFASGSENETSKVSLLQRLARIVFRMVGGTAILYAIILLVGLFPVNNDFEPSKGGIEVTVVSNAVHADLVLPKSNQKMDWRSVFPDDCFRRNVTNATHIAIGWGDKGFFLETRTWADFKASVAAKALLVPSDACMHVSMGYQPTGGRSVHISPEQYDQIVQHILNTVPRDGSGHAIQIPNQSYGQNDAFFVARGNYHCLNTCNSWVGRALRGAGIRTCLLSPLPKTPCLYFPNSE